MQYMISADKAQEIVKQGIGLVPAEEVPFLESHSRILREDIISDTDIPPFANSAMDGYAARYEDIKSVPAELTVIENIPAGSGVCRMPREKEAVRIMTGAPVPPGADTVIRQEDTERCGDMVKILKSPKKGSNIRMCGEDIKKGELIIKKGTKIRSAHLGILASAGRSRVKVSIRPRAGILATGNELVDADSSPGPGRIRNSNSCSLYGQVRMCGARPVILGIAKDDKKEILKKIEEGVQNDILIISGGVSVGDYDFVQPCLRDLGASVKFWKTAIRPGKPVLFAVLGDIPVFGLPGNPVSSMVAFELFVKPVIYKMTGYNFESIRYIEAELEEDIRKKRGLRYFLRAVTKWGKTGYTTRTTGPQGSGILKSMILSNSLIDLPEDIEKAKKGSKVKVRFFGH